MEAVRAKVGDGRLDEKCEKDGCRVSLKGVPQPHLIIDFDEQDSPLGKSQTRCDYLFVADGNRNGGWAEIPIEGDGEPIEPTGALRRAELRRTDDSAFDQGLKILSGFVSFLRPQRQFTAHVVRYDHGIGQRRDDSFRGPGGGKVYRDARVGDQDGVRISGEA